MKALAAAASFAVLAAPAMAQAPETRIEADTAPNLSLGTTVSPTGSIHVVDGGTRAGANLFHSFSRFDIAAGDTARFVHGAGDPGAVVNVISRVTGGTPSAIYGTIDSTAIPNADFWFINPAGIVFGEGAQLDVPAAAHFSSASALRFGGGADFAVTTPAGSTLSVSPPTAWGFVGGEGAILVEQAGRVLLPPGGRLSLVASDVTVTGSTIAGGRFDLVGVGDQAAEVSVSDPPATGLTGEVSVQFSVLRLDGNPTGTDGIRIAGGAVRLDGTDLGTDIAGGADQGVSGPIRISGDSVMIANSLVSASTFGSEPAGDIEISGREIVVTGGSTVSNDARIGSTGAAGLIGIEGRSIRIDGNSRVSSSTQTAQAGGGILLVGESVRLSSARIASDSLAATGGNAGAILISGGALDVENGALITSSTLGSGNGGAILIDVSGPVTLRGAFIDSRAEEGSSGDAGVVAIAATSLSLFDASGVSTATFGTGTAGTVGISADTVLLDGLSEIESVAGEQATGAAGQVLIEGGRLTVTGLSAIRSDTLGVGDGGGIVIEMDEVEISGEGRISSDSLIECAGDPCATGGKAGDIAIEAGILRILGVAEFGPPSPAISSDSRASGDAGSIDLDLGRLEMDGNVFISSDTSGSGAGGTVTITAKAVALRNLAMISTGTTGAGAGGSIAIDTPSLLMEADARILSQSRSGFGAPGGTIDIRAGEAVIRGSEINSSGLGSGDAGDIEIGGSRLELDLGAILSDTQGEGQGGDIVIRSNEVVLRRSSLIAADSLGCFAFFCASIGDAGSVTIVGDSLTIGGADDPDVGLQGAKISSEAFATGDAGDISIRVNRLSLDIGTISSGTSGEGDAGTIDIESGEISLVNFSAIGTSSVPFCPDGVCLPGGDAGSVLLRARGDVTLSGFSQITSNTSASGNAGAVAVEARNLSLARSRITTASEIGATGAAGAIGIVVGDLIMTDGSEISSEASNALPAGAILIEADRVRLQDPLSRVSSANNAEGNAGAVLIGTRTLELIEGGGISTSSTEGAAGDIVIAMPEDGLFRLIGRTFTSEITTSSGPGTGGRIVISSPYAIVSDGGFILALGQQGGANVQIQTGFFIRSADRLNQVAVDGDFLLEAQVGDVSSGTVERDLSILDASGVLRGQCAATRATGQVSQLVVRPVGPYGEAGTGIRAGTGCR